METKNELSITAGSEVSGHSDLEPVIRELTNLFRRNRLNYDQAIYVAKAARKRAGVVQAARPKRLPKNLTEDQRSLFFVACAKAGGAEHELIFRLLYVTGLRVSEVCALKRGDVDIASRSIRVNQGKGSKDRVVLITDELALPLGLYMDSTRENAYLFETNRKSAYSSRWIEKLAERYGWLAGIEGMTPHRLRHTLLTDLTRAGLSDAQIQLVSGHSSKKALEVYQHLALTDVASDYQEAMRRKR